MKDLGRCTLILGIEVEQKNGSVKISQPSTIERTLECHGMSECMKVSTPLPGNYKLDPATDDEVLEDIKEY
ncbi:hypothetical protein GGH15_006194, partial [Coemansia sp. RSA 562]